MTKNIINWLNVEEITQLGIYYCYNTNNTKNTKNSKLMVNYPYDIEYLKGSVWAKRTLFFHSSSGIDPGPPSKNVIKNFKIKLMIKEIIE